MNTSGGSLLDYVEMLKRKAPEYLDLLAAENDEEFEKAFDAILDKAVIHLEKNKKNFASLDEEGLSAVLAGSISVPGLTVSQEKHSGGHVDLTFEANQCIPARTMLGEAKIYDGPSYHVNGLGQLLNRYVTGRECRNLMIVYVRKKDIKGLMEKLRKRLDEDLPVAQVGATIDHTLKWSFVSTHKHSCDENLQVCHVGCNLYFD